MTSPRRAHTVATSFDARRLARAVRRIEELRAWRNARETPIPDWTFTAGAQTATLQPKDFWPVVETPVAFAATATVPLEWAGQPVELELWLGGEGLVTLSTGRRAGLNALHHAFPVVEAAEGGETIAIEAEVSPKGMFGSHVAEPRIERAHLVVPHRELRALERDLAMVNEACAVLGVDEHEAVPPLLDAIDAAYAALGFAWPTDTETTVSRFVLGYTDTIGSGLGTVPPGFASEAIDVRPATGQGLWSLPPAPRPLEPLPEEALAAIPAARGEIAARLARIKENYPPVGRLALTGHAHIDLAWLWPLAETRRKLRRTFNSVLDLMDRYPDFVFNQSSAQAYAWLEEDDPDLLERIKVRVAEGRWETIGGSWLEPDCEVTGGEAFVRQLFYGQRYFQQTFGKRSTVAWLPDVFGFSGGIPQLLLGAGIANFFTIKLTWSEANTFPHDLFAWEGIDGSRVTAAMFRNLPPAHGYNGNIAPLDAIGTWQAFGGKRHHPESLLAFGWGDGGGGPSARQLENYARLKDFPALPRLRMAKIEDYFADLPDPATLPTWVGELYLEYHRATLTTQAMTKRFNREAEHRLLEAEAFGAIAGATGFSYPRPEIEAAWKLLLLNQFHDILPGSSINEVYQDNHRQMEEAIATATVARDAALVHLGGAGNGLLVANAGLSPRPLSVLLPGRDADAGIRDADGSPLPTQATADGLLVHDPGRTVPGLGWFGLAVGDPADASPPVGPVRVAAAEDGGATLQNALLRVEIGGDGALHRVFDREARREVLADRANQLWLYVDKPRTYDAWDIEETYEQEGEELGGVERVEVVEDGPLRGAVRVHRAFRGSRLTQTYRLLAGSRRIEIATEIDWHERLLLLRARFPLAIRAHEATYETMYGALTRPTHRNTSWDATRFEVGAHRWADLSEPGYGVALLNDAKYGHAAHGNVLSLSLVRGPLYPDPLADEGAHRFTYALLPHPGDWTEANVVGEAFALNSPLLVAPAATDPADGAMLHAEGVPLALGALKPAEDGPGLILRVYEPHGARGVATLRFTEPVRAAVRVNLLEEPTGGAVEVVDGHAVRFAVRPFEVVTVRVEMGGS